MTVAGWIAAGAALALACTAERQISLLEPAAGDPDSGADAAPPPDVDALRRAACGRWTAEREPEPALLMLVVDVSGSMNTLVTQELRRWDVTRAVLSAAIDAMPSSVGVGVLYYPNMATTPGIEPRPVSACVNVQSMIPVALLGSRDSRQRGMILGSLGATEPNPMAGTPTLDAYLAGLEMLGRTTLAGSRQMLLITDGQPTFAEGCVGTGAVDIPVDAGPVIDAVTAAHRAGIKTFVIGTLGSEYTVPGDDMRPFLSRAAAAGGTGAPGCTEEGPRYCHFDMVREPDFRAGLASALDDISSSIVRCDFSLPDPPVDERVDLDAVNVVFSSAAGDEVLLSNDPSPSCRDGWQYSPDRERIVLCPDVCARARAAVGGALEFLFGCATVTRDRHGG